MPPRLPDPAPPAADPGRPVVGGARTTRRRGRMSPAKHRALRDLSATWTVPAADASSPASLAAAFGRDARRVLDVGVGTGEATVALAVATPELDVLAVELHRPGIARLLGALDEGGPANVRVVEADVTALVADAAPGAVHDVRVLFPDPWPKRRHRARRLVDATFVAGLARLLPPGGTLHVATDWEPYAEQVREVLGADGRFAPRVDAGDPAVLAGPDSWSSARPPRPVTTYERRGLAAGRVVTDLVARRT